MFDYLHSDQCFFVSISVFIVAIDDFSFFSAINSSLCCLCHRIFIGNFQRRNLGITKWNAHEVSVKLAPRPFVRVFGFQAFFTQAWRGSSAQAP